MAKTFIHPAITASVSSLQITGEDRVDCPHCKGKGEIEYSVERSGEPTIHSKMDCITCGGRKTVTVSEAKHFEDGKRIWCDCGNPSGESSYHGDHSGGVVSKHHYTCIDCGKVTQIG